MLPQTAVAGKRVVLVPLQPEHLESLARWDADPEVTRYAGRKFRRDADAPQWLANLVAHPHRLGFAITLPPHGLIGDLELEDIDPDAASAELRICIGDKRFWGQGLGEDAIRAACRHAFTALGLRRIYLRVPLPHWRAIRCYTRCGFRPEGVLRAGRRRLTGLADQLLMTLDADAFHATSAAAGA